MKRKLGSAMAIIPFLKLFILILSFHIQNLSFFQLELNHKPGHLRGQICQIHSSMTFPGHPSHWISRKGTQPLLAQAFGIFHPWLKKRLGKKINKHSDGSVPLRTLFGQTEERGKEEVRKR